MPAIHAGSLHGQPVVNFCMPTAENLVPIRVDVELDNKRYKDTFCWNATDPDTEVVAFVKRALKELDLPMAFVIPVVQAIQAQLADFRAYEGQELSCEESLVLIKLEVRVNSLLIRDQFLWDLGWVSSDPEAFAVELCRDLGVDEHLAAICQGLISKCWCVRLVLGSTKSTDTNVELKPAVAFAIREQLLEAVKQRMAARDSRLSKKPRRDRVGPDTATPMLFKAGQTAASLMRRPNGTVSVLRRKTELSAYEPTVELLTEKEIEAMDIRDERSTRNRRRADDKDSDSLTPRYGKS